MDIAVLVQAYPSESDPYPMAFVHTRIAAYAAEGVGASVLNFGSPSSYEYEGFEVVGTRDRKRWASTLRTCDLVVSHAPNVRNHIRILRRLRASAVLLVFHGHEVLRFRDDYPAPYPWDERPMQSLIRNAYDPVKLSAVRRSIDYIARRNAVGLMFVSDWLRAKAMANLQYNPDSLSFVETIPNPVDSVFLRKSYDESCVKDGDFVSIRSLDDSKRAVDLLIRLAYSNQDKSFALYGRGSLFDHIEKPANLSWHDRFLSHDEIPGVLNRYRAAVLPSRFDTQGVTACEIASYGMPLIASDLAVTRSFLGDFPNVRLMDESEFSRPIGAIPNPGRPAVNPFRAESTTQRELNAMRVIIGKAG